MEVLEIAPDANYAKKALQIHVRILLPPIPVDLECLHKVPDTFIYDFIAKLDDFDINKFKYL
jgi:hypothetical protein